MVHDRLKKLRERIQRKEKSTRASRRAKSRRIDRGKPKGAAEAARVKARQAKQEAQMSAEEARGLASDAKQLVATEVGVSESESEGIIRQGAGLIRDAGDSLSELDLDGDGDTDILSGVDPLDPRGGGGSGGGGNTDLDALASEPVYDPFEDDAEDDLALDF